jgi:sn-glycerol 3-phosphate transport system substrate-binding protein
MAPAIGALVDAGQACGYVTCVARAHPAGERRRLARGFARRVRQRDGALGGHAASWQRSGYFSYAAQAEDAERRFAAGQCAYLTASPSRQVELRSRAAFDLGVAPLPELRGFRRRAAGRRRRLAPARGGRSASTRRRGGSSSTWRVRKCRAEWREMTGGARLAPAGYDLPALRRIVDEELESVWVGKKTAIDALNTAVLRGNQLISK